MPLVYCPECQSEVSDRAAACPRCGYPIASGNLPARQPTPPPVTRPRRQGSFLSPRFALAATGFVALTGIFAMAGTEEEGFGVVAMLMLWSSAIPIWWKARRKARHAAITGGADVERRIEERLKEMEERFRAPLARLEDGGQQLMEIEERMDFLERLLTKVRDDQIGPG